MEMPLRQKLRVMTLVDRSLGFGGAERLAAQVTMRLDPGRFERMMCTSRPSASPIMTEVEESGVRVLSLDRSCRAALWQWWPLVSFLRRERVDVLHAHKFSSNAWASVIGPLAQVPVVLAHEHSWSYHGQHARYLLDRHVVARGATLILAVSAEDRRRMIELEHIDPAKILFVPNGIPDVEMGDGRRVRAELGISPAAPVVGTVANLRAPKALDVLVEAAALLVPRFPDLRVVIVGQGPLEGALRALIRDRKVCESVLLLGRRTDVPDVLAAVDVAVCSSDSEGSPLAVMEYMRAGKPVVSTHVGGIPDLIEDGTHGLLVDRRDVPGLASAIGRLLEDPVRRLDMGARARDRQQRDFDLDVMVRRIELLYEDLFRSTRRAARDGWTPTVGRAADARVVVRPSSNSRQVGPAASPPPHELDAEPRRLQGSVGEIEAERKRIGP